MSPSPDSAAEQQGPPSNIGRLHKQQKQQQRKRAKAADNVQSRGRDASRNEAGRGDTDGERVSRIYPREIAKSPPAVKRYSSASPTGPQTYNATTSPLLSAIGATRPTNAQYTTEWTKSLPFFTSQAPTDNGMNINGSPPNYHHSPGTHERLISQAAMSNSPPAPGGRPLSHPNHYTSFGGRLKESPHQSPARDRRASMYSQYGSPQPFSTNPPLPHQPQAHFYNLPDLNLGLNNAAREGVIPGEGGYYCGLDTLSMGGDEPSKASENVVLVGYEGGLEVFRVERSKLDIIGRLEGLRGSVIGAKILPWTLRKDPFASMRPLVSVVIHGPVIDDTKSGSSGSGSSSVIDDSSSPSRPSSTRGTDPNGKVNGYQTTVEVYSLKEQAHVATLYKSPLLPLTSPIDSPMFEPPKPAGDFVIDAKGKFVVVSSGASGEVFVFAPYLTGHEDHHEKFRCIGKVWTTVQFRDRGTHSSASSAADAASHEDVPPEQFGVPVFSLSDRWLAVSPPASTTLFPINGVALTSPSHERPPGLAHHTVPPQPAATCSVEAPEATSLINRLTREGTQVAIKGAQWATAKGIQAFKSYMGKAPQPNGNINGAIYGGDHMYQQQQQAQFPPTHGQNQAQPRAEATIISIYDLQKLFDAEETKNKNALHAIATIPASLGCSFLSFSPSGLMLMTVSKKGDFQDVWDLKRMNYRRTRKSAREQATGPHVRQVARFARMTITNVIDVIWSAPRVDKLAVITDKGTVHMFLMPYSAFQWPPPRRVKKAGAQKPKDDKASSGGVYTVTSAMQAINGTAKPFLDAVRTRNSGNSGSRFPTFSSLGVTPAAGAKSGKAVAAGVGKSINNIRHAGDNKLALPSSPSGVKPNSVRWLTGKCRGCIALVAGGTLQIYRVQMRPATSKGKSANATSITKRKLVEFGLAPIPNSLFPPSVAAQLFPQPDASSETFEIHGEWLPRSLPSRRGRTGAGGKKLPTAAPLSYAEIETNPPYQPFYTDRRVTRFAFSRHAPDVQASTTSIPSPQPSLSQIPELVSNLHHNDDNDTPWLFGSDIEATRLSSPATHYDSGSGDGSDHEIGLAAARVEKNKLVLRDGEEEVEQVVVTTRRRKVRRGEEGDVLLGEEGFFEDDCEVLDFAEDRV